MFVKSLESDAAHPPILYHFALTVYEVVPVFFKWQPTNGVLKAPYSNAVPAEFTVATFPASLEVGFASKGLAVVKVVEDEISCAVHKDIPEIGRAHV